MLKTALLLLTLNDTGAIRMTLTEAESPQDCLVQAGAVEQILTGAGYTIVGMRCGETALALTPFLHGTPADEEIWQYRATLHGTAPEDGFALEPITHCAVPDTEGVYCTVSAQAPAGQND